VIAVNAAILRDFGGPHLAIPVRYADELLKQKHFSETGVLAYEITSKTFARLESDYG
jgi:hypothetical protein